MTDKTALEILKENYKITEEDLLNAPKVLRTHCYVMNPALYDIACPLCHGTGKITWSEFESHIWCYKCEKDVLIVWQTSGIFSGPIPMELTRMMGISFDRMNAKTGAPVTADWLYKTVCPNRETIEYRMAMEFYNSTWVRDEKLIAYENELINRTEETQFGNLDELEKMEK